MGRRLGSLAFGRPKALVEVGGMTLLERLLEALEACGFRHAFVVTGHQAESIERFAGGRRGALAVSTIHNPDYATTNNIVSLLAASHVTANGFCLLNSDIIVEASVIAETATKDAGSWLVIDGDEPLGAEEMKVELDPGGVVWRISKGLDAGGAVGEYIGVARFDAAGAGALLASAARLVGNGEVGLYYEDAIDRAAVAIGARALMTRGRLWTEIDDEVDYERAVGIAVALDSGRLP